MSLCAAQHACSVAAFHSGRCNKSFYALACNFCSLEPSVGNWNGALNTLLGDKFAGA